jgi:hypothetical protein
VVGLFGGIASVLFAWAGFGLIFIGLGLFIRHLFGLKIPDAGTVFASFWIGWAFAILFLQLWNLQFKVDWRPLVILTIGSAAGLFRNWDALRQTIKERAPQRGPLCLIVLLVALFLARRAILPPGNSDSGLYHFTSVRWVASYPIVPGLGNLHYRIAFNSSYFLYAALLDIGPWAHKSHHLANGLLLFILLTQLLLSSFKLLNAEQLRAHPLFDLVLLAPVLEQALTANTSSPSPDAAIFVLGLVITRHLLMLFTNATCSRRETGYALAYITILSAIGTAIKLSFLALGSATSLLAISIWFVEGSHHDTIKDRKTLTFMATGVALVLVPWMIRGIILSGYIAYPISLGSLPVEWRIPRGDVIEIANVIQAFGKQPGIDSKMVSDWNWLGPWLRRMSTSYVDVVLPLLLTGAGCLAGLYHITTKSQPKVSRVAWLFLLPTIVSLIFWFLAAPNLRFAGSLFWVLAAGAITLAAQELDNSARRQLFRFASVASLSILAMAAGLSALSVVDGKSAALRVMLKDKNPLKAFHALYIESAFDLAPRGDWTTFVTNSGLTIYVPKSGTQCWDAPLPCARRPLPKLRLRQEGDMSRGFILDGTQLAEN